MAKRPSPFIVTGPGVEKGYDDFGPALSRAITAASSRPDVTAYVHEQDRIVAFAESDGSRNVKIVSRRPTR